LDYKVYREYSNFYHCGSFVARKLKSLPGGFAVYASFSTDVNIETQVKNILSNYVDRSELEKSLPNYKMDEQFGIFGEREFVIFKKL